MWHIRSHEDTFVELKLLFLVRKKAEEMFILNSPPTQNQRSEHVKRAWLYLLSLFLSDDGGHEACDACFFFFYLPR
jgi:hypothetical protein